MGLWKSSVKMHTFDSVVEFFNTPFPKLEMIITFELGMCDTFSHISDLFDIFDLIFHSNEFDCHWNFCLNMTFWNIYGPIQYR